MLAVQNTIGIKIGNVLQGTAEGPLAIGALLLIAVVVVAAAVYCWRNPPS